VQTDPYHKIAEFYDLEHDPFDDDLIMYQQFVEAAGDPVLDLGCGTGRVSRFIADQGFRVVGIDASEPMLKRATNRSDDPSRHPSPEFAQLDMKNANLAAGGPFGVAIIALDTFTHLSTQEEQIEALESVHKALDPRGQLIVDVFNPQPDILSGFDGTVIHEHAWTLKEGPIVQKFSARQALPGNQTIEAFAWYDMIGHDTRVSRFPMQFTQRYVMRDELLLMMAIAGFEDFICYGDYDLSPYEGGSPRLIVAAEMTKTPRL